MKGTKADQKNDIFFFDVTLLEETLYLEKMRKSRRKSHLFMVRFIKPFDFSDREVNEIHNKCLVVHCKITQN